MTDKVTIWNLALSAVGSRALISDPLEKGREADLCRLFYPRAVSALLKSASWPCANAWARLAVVAERDFNIAWVPGPLSPEWRFAYGAPSNMLAPRYLQSYARFDVGNYDEQTLIFTQEVTPILRYTKMVEREETFDEALVSSVVALLASKLCLPLTGKDTRTRALREETTEIVLLARTEMANESESEVDALPSWLQARGLAMSPRATHYFYPYYDINQASF